MTITLRLYQVLLEKAIYNAWMFCKNIMAVLPTGSGKTYLFAKIISDHKGASCAIAHRQELISQISLALGQYGVRHNIIGQDSLIRHIVGLHIDEFGKSFYDANALCAVAGVDTLPRRKNLQAWFHRVTLVVQDEGHHILKRNKWGKALKLFPNAKVLAVTATPVRADGRGLGRSTDGCMDLIVEGPGMRELINQGHLTDYRIWCPRTEIDLSKVHHDKSGDYERTGLVKAVRKSQIVGDVVEHYLRIAPGKLGITFATDVKTAQDIADRYNAAGVPAKMICGETPDRERTEALKKFKARKILQLVNVDLFGEGFDVPAVEVITMARPTESFGLYAQQFGRGLRPLPDKQHAIIIDHVGNVIRHGAPDAPREWSLDARERRPSGVVLGIALTVCPQCTAAYERIYRSCPYCGYIPIPASRSSAEFVDGDLLELDADALAQLRGAIAAVDMTLAQKEAQLQYMSPVIVATNVKRLKETQEAQHILRDSIKIWAGHQRDAQRPDSEIYRRFYLKFGTDIMGAQALHKKEAEKLTGWINNNMEA